MFEEGSFVQMRFITAINTAGCKENIIRNVIHKSSHRKYSVKNMFSGILHNSQEVTFTRDSFLIKLQASLQP